MCDTIEKQVPIAGMQKQDGVLTHHKLKAELKPAKYKILEFEDVLFHLNSAVMMPASPEGKSSKDGGGAGKDQEKISGVQALAVVFKQFEFSEDERMVIAGHTDTSGDDEFNFILSDLRAKNVLYLLIGNRDEWAKLSYSRHKVEDYQQILKHVFTHRKWSFCDPGKIDDAYGPKTQKATDRFVLAYNAEFASKNKHAVRLHQNHAQMVAKDGKHRWPEEMWKAVFHLYEDDLCRIMKTTLPQLKSLRSKLKFIHDDKKVEHQGDKRTVACGESFPKDQAYKDKYRSIKNRRVEIVFFDKTEAPVLDCPVDIKTKHKKEDCPLWHGFNTPVFLDPNDLYAVVYHITFKYFDRVEQKMAEVPENLPIKAFEQMKGKGKKKSKLQEVPTAVECKNGVYTVKVQFGTSLDDPDREALFFEFKKPDGQDELWIFTEGKGKTPKIVNKKLEDIKKMDLEERLKYYDLPAYWSSQNYWTRYNGDMETGDRWETVIKKFKPFTTKVTSSGKNIIFSLEDIVLVDENGKQDLKDKKITCTLVDDHLAPVKDGDGNHLENPAGTKLYYKTTNLAEADENLGNKSRVAMFYVKDGKFLLYKQEIEDKRPRTCTDYKFDKNLITDTPTDGQSRLVIFCNKFYHVLDKRTAQGAEPYDSTKKHVRGCRAARLKDTDWHVHVPMKYDSGTWPAQDKYLAQATGNFELHYIHDCWPISGPEKLKRRSFLMIYWNGYFVSYPAVPALGVPAPAKPPKDYSVNTAKIKDYATKGMMNAKKRWEDKEYSIEPLNPPNNADDCDVQIKPVFFFESKWDNLGGLPKCTVRVSNNPDDGEMGITNSTMYWRDYDLVPCSKTGTYLPPPPPKVNSPYDYMGKPGKDIDGKTYKSLVVAHELGHATGKDDEYAYMRRFNQYYPGMPYQIDKDSMMKSNRSPRMKHVWLFVNWVNHETRALVPANPPAKPNPDPAGNLNALLGNTQFRIRNRNGGKDLKYYLTKTPNDYRNFYSPFKSELLDSGAGTTGLATGTGGSVDAALYKLGEDEFSWAIKIGGKKTSFAFDGILAVYIKIKFKFYDAAAGSTAYKKYNDVHNNWNNTAQTVIRDWKEGIKKPIQKLNGRFYVQHSNPAAQTSKDFKRTHLFLFPVTGTSNADHKDDEAHFIVRVVLDDTAKITRPNATNGWDAKEIQVGCNVPKSWLAHYILGNDDGKNSVNFFERLLQSKPGKKNLGFVVNWFKGANGVNDNGFVLKGS